MSALPPTTASSSDSSAEHGFYAWTTLQGIYYGPGSLITALPKLLEKLGASKALIVTGNSLYTKTGVVKKVEAVLRERSAYGGTFYNIGQHSPIAGILEGVKAFKECGADIIVSVGGGSPIDAAKAILYNLQQETGAPLLKQIAIPTTLSAAEYTGGAGYTNEQGKKVAVSTPGLEPGGIILDAELTIETPERLWLSTGLRALDHAVENLYRDVIPYPLKMLFYGAIADLFTCLPQSKVNPAAIDIRQKLQLASWMSIWPLKLESYSALGLSHALGHKLGAAYSIPHGITSCLTLARVVALQVDLASPQHKQNLAQSLFYLRQESTGSVDGDILKLSGLINTLVVDLGLVSTLSYYKVPKDDLPSIAEQALGISDRSDARFTPVVKLLEDLY